MVITHKTNTKLEDAYYNIKWRLDNAGIKYETENNIIPQWDPNAKDEFGNQLPKPDPFTVGTGTAWIKIYFEDRKQVFVYFCCHLVECSTCTYDRFITVYNYTDDVMDTNLQGMIPALTLKYYGDKAENDSDRTIYFDMIDCTEDGALFFRKPRSLADTKVNKCQTCNGSGKISQQVTIPTRPGQGGDGHIIIEKECTDCHGTGYEDSETEICTACDGKGTIESTVTVPSGNPYKKAVQIKVTSTCTNCNGSGRISKTTSDDYCTISTLNLYNFYVKKSQTERDVVDNRINDGMRIREDGANAEYDNSDKNEGGLRKFAKRLFSNANTYDPEDVPVDDLTKITTFNTEIYIDPDTGKPLSTIEELYELIAKTNLNNEYAEDSEKVDLSKYVFPIPVFKQHLIPGGDNTIITDYKIEKLNFYQTNYVDQQGNLIPLTVFFNCDLDVPDLINVQNRLAVSDLFPERAGYTQSNVFPTRYNNGLTYTSNGVKNFIKHCGEVEIYADPNEFSNKVVKPYIKTFTNISQTDLVWNFICFKDKNLPIIPVERNTLYINQSNTPHTIDLYKENVTHFDNILSQKTASYAEPLDKPMVTPDSYPYIEPDSKNVYPIDYFKGSCSITSFESLSGESPDSLYFTGISNNNTLNFDHEGINPTYDYEDWPDYLDGITFKNYTLNLLFTFTARIKFNKVDKHIEPGSYADTVLSIKVGLVDTATEYNEKPLIIFNRTIDVDMPYEGHIDPDDPTKLYYDWPDYANETIQHYATPTLINEAYQSYDGHGEFVCPLKHCRLVVFCEPFKPSSSVATPSPYSLNPGDFSLELDFTLATNIDPIPAESTLGYPLKKGATNVVSIPKIKYNYNNYPEGIFSYYHKNFGTYIENYIFNKYHSVTGDSNIPEGAGFLDMVYNETDKRMEFVPDTIESQKKYKGFMNIIHSNKLRSIYVKQDTRNDYIVCPACNGNEKINCPTCGNKRKLSLYDYSGDTCPICNGNTEKPCSFCHNTGKVDYLKRYRCPSLDSTGIDHVNHDDKDENGRCRICAGTKSIVRYYYLKTFDFADITNYVNKLPENIPDLNKIEDLDIVTRVLQKNVQEKGSKLSEYYLNYIIRKHYGIVLSEGTSHYAWEEGYSLYNAAVSNLVFYILNGKFVKYKFWNGNTHIDVEYGYNYIYSIKTYTKKEWDAVQYDSDLARNTKVLYRIIEDATDVDQLIGFYTILIPDINTNYYIDGEAFKGCAIQRIYFDKEWVYNNLLKDMKFNQFNIFTEKEEPIVGAEQKLPEDIIVPPDYHHEYLWYAHIHNENEAIADLPCPDCEGVGSFVCPTCGGSGTYDHHFCMTCRGTGKVTCTTCNGSGDNPDTDVEPIELRFLKYLYIYTSHTYINTDNMSFEINDQPLPTYDGEEIEEIDFEE